MTDINEIEFNYMYPNFEASFSCKIKAQNDILNKLVRKLIEEKAIYENILDRDPHDIYEISIVYDFYRIIITSDLDEDNITAMKKMTDEILHYMKKKKFLSYSRV